MIGKLGPSKTLAEAIEPVPLSVRVSDPTKPDNVMSDAAASVVASYSLLPDAVICAFDIRVPVMLCVPPVKP